MSRPASSGQRVRALLEYTWARVVLALALAVTAGVLIGYAVFGGENDGPRAPATIPAGTAAAAVGAVVRFDQFGLSLRRPAGWSSGIRAGVLNVAAPDETVSVAVAMPQGRPDARELRGTDRVELAKLFHARVVGRRRYAIGPLPTLVTELLGRTKRGTKVRILSMASSTRWRTYSVQVFSVVQPEKIRALELQSLITSFRFRKPR